MKDVCDILGLSDGRSAKKWLYDNNVPISKIGSSPVVNSFSFELKRQQLLVEELRISYPNNWFEIYDANTKDKGMVKSIKALYPVITSTIKIKKNNKINNYIT